MPQSISFGKIQSNPAAGNTAPAADAPFRVLVLGDFSGRANRGLHEPLASRESTRPIPVDCDTLDHVMASLGVTLELPVSQQAGAATPVRFNALDDFHPDALYDRLGVFQTLKDSNKHAADPLASEPIAPEDSSEDQGGMSPGRPSPPQGTLQRTRKMQALAQPVVVPQAAPNPSLAKTRLAPAVNDAVTKQMRAILHHRDFQSLETTWRGLDFLARNMETGQHLQLFILDVTQEELAADVNTTEDLQSTGLYRLLAEQTADTADSQPWAVVAGNFTFDATCDDIQTLGRIAKIASASGAPFLAAAHPHLVGSQSLAQSPELSKWTHSLDAEITQAWRALRKLDEASHLGLALPRFLLRLPYGQGTHATERFEFQEIETNPSDEQYAWGNPAFICAYLLSQSFSQDGWGFTPDCTEPIEDLPAYTYTQDGESKMTPCAQAWLSDTAAEAILNKGLMPLLSIQGRDAVKLARFQSLANPATDLAGWWGVGDSFT